MYILIIECTDINTESTLDARDFLREEPWNGNKQSTSGEKRDNREDVRKPLVTRDSWLILPRQ